jgi:hypothetical protein
VLLTRVSLVPSFRPVTEKKTSIAFSIAFIADDRKTTLKGRFKRRPVAALQGLREVSLLSVLLPQVDGMRDGNAFHNLLGLGFATEHARNTT